MSGVGSPPTVIIFFSGENTCLRNSAYSKNEAWVFHCIWTAWGMPTNRNSEGMSLWSLAFLIGENICMHTTENILHSLQLWLIRYFKLGFYFLSFLFETIHRPNRECYDQYKNDEIRGQIIIFFIVIVFLNQNIHSKSNLKISARQKFH